tara:strand:- start:89 stop:652 length:564 start_codon:yes stop_codon:yes gene_type:complete
MEFGTDLYTPFEITNENNKIDSACNYDKEFDFNYYKYAAWESNESVKTLFSKKILDATQKKITHLLKGVHPDGRDIIVPIETIGSVFSQFLDKSPTNRELGDIYSRFIIENPNEKGLVQSIVERSMAVIVKTITNEYGMIENNKKLSIWTTVLGDFNKHGLNSFSQSQITGAIRKKRPQTMAFNMNY